MAYPKGQRFTDEHKRKLSLAHIGKSVRNGMKNSEETKEKIRLSNINAHKKIDYGFEKGKYAGFGFKRGHKTNVGKPSGMLGKHHTKEWKEKRALQIFPLKDTSIEVKIQNFLKTLGIDFFTHQYIREIEHGYQCDILIPSMNLVIECDGNYWHKYPVGNDIDKIRTSELVESGFRVLRLWESDINSMDLNKFQEVLNG